MNYFILQDLNSLLFLIIYFAYYNFLIIIIFTNNIIYEIEQMILD